MSLAARLRPDSPSLLIWTALQTLMRQPNRTMPVPPNKMLSNQNYPAVRVPRQNATMVAIR
ncbi:hypothetical protein X739_32845 [Mesorhizobium sp. LNHC220B00]|nr:hypothetical protein X739_32845 [Mesorhizobium sp. LNHC220B00]